MRTLDVIGEKIPGKLKIALLGISVLLNIIMALALFSSYSSLSEKEAQLNKLNSWVSYSDHDVKSKKSELTELQTDLERIRKEREALGLSNDSLNQQITDLKATILQLEKQPKLDQTQMMKLEQLIAKLKNQIIQKDRQIAALKMENDSLITDVNNLKTESLMLTQSLDSTESILELASVLKAENIQVDALKDNGKEMWGSVYRGKRVDRVRVTFSLADNKVARKGLKEFQIALTTPEGKIFSDYLNGGGVVSLKDGARMPYTMAQTVAFNNKREKLTFTMLKGFDYEPGIYKITVFSDGYKIGEGNFEIK